MAENHHRDWNAALLLLLIVVGFYWKLTLSKQYTWLDSPDFAYQVMPWLQFQAGEWHRGQFPLWDPYEWGGQPLIGQAQPGTAYPLNWILFSLPLREGRIRMGYLHWYFVLIHYLGALFCYWLCRDLKRSRAASLLAALVFALGGWMGSTGWPQMLNGAVWAPLVFLFLLRAMRGERLLVNAAISGMFLGVAFLSGHHQIPIFVTLATAGVWLYGLFRDGRFNLHLLAPACAFAIFLFLASGLQTFPAYEYGKLALRWVSAPAPVGWNDPVPYSVHHEYGLYPLSILGIVIPGLYRHANPFIGVVAASLAFLGVAGEWRERTVRIIGAVALGGLIFSLASFTIFQGVLYALVPMVEKARTPSMAIFIFHFGISVLTAYGLDSCLTNRNAEWGRRLVVVLLGAVAALWFALLVLAMLQTPKALDHDRIALVGFAGVLLAGLLCAWRRDQISRRAFVTAVPAVLLLEIGMFHVDWKRRDDPQSLLKKLSQHTDIVQFLRSRPEPVRVELNDDEIPYNFGDWFQIDVFGAYLASMTTNIQRVQPGYQARMLFGTNFYVGSKPRREGQVDVFTGNSGLKVYANPEAFPRVWSVHRAVGIRQISDIATNLKKSLTDLREGTFLFGAPPPLESCALPDDVRLLRRETNAVVIEATMQCKGMVVAGETFFPGWEATVDGKPAPIYEAYTALRGVVVDSGSHRVEMRYKPRSVYWGAFGTMLAVAGACFKAFRAGTKPAVREPAPGENPGRASRQSLRPGDEHG